MTCPACGASARPGASWCGQCHGSLSAPTSRFVPAAAAPAVVPVYSRWHGGPTSLGPFGRVSWTVGVLLVGLFSLVSGDIFFVLLWWLLFGPLILRSVWQRARTR